VDLFICRMALPTSFMNKNRVGSTRPKIEAFIVIFTFSINGGNNIKACQFQIYEHLKKCNLVGSQFA
jgi:hypothetical protein